MEKRTFFEQFNSLIQLIKEKEIILEVSPMSYKSTKTVVTIKSDDEEWHPLSDGYYRFTEGDVDRYNYITKKNGVYYGDVTDGFKKWLTAYFDREDYLETPKYLNQFPKSNYSYAYYRFTKRDVEIFENSGGKAIGRGSIPTKQFKEWLDDEVSGKHKQYMVADISPEQTQPLVEISPIETSQLSFLDKLLGQYGSIYTPSTVIETVDDIVGEEDKKKVLDDFFVGFQKFNTYNKVLRRVRLLPSYTFILFGASGTGKTSLARAYAKKYGLPIIVIQSSRIVSSLLGDTLRNVNHIFENAEMFIKDQNLPVILFFDEIDALGSERGGSQDVGEIKRLTITFMQTLDRLNYDGSPIIVFGASNHEELLDKAIWRRFTFHLNFGYPNYHQRRAIILSYLEKLKFIEVELGEQFKMDSNIESDIENDYNWVVGQVESSFNGSIVEFPTENIKQEAFWDLMSDHIEVDNIFRLSFGYTGADIERGFKNLLFESARVGKITYESLKSNLIAVGSTYEKEQKYQKTRK